MKNLRMILMSIMTMFMIIGNVNSQEEEYEFYEFNVSSDGIGDGFTTENFDQDLNKFIRKSGFDNTISYVGFTIPKDLIGMDDGGTYKIKIELKLDILIKDINDNYKVIVNGVGHDIGFGPLLDQNGDMVVYDHGDNNFTNLGEFDDTFTIEVEVTGDVDIRVSSDEGSHNDRVTFVAGKMKITNMGVVPGEGTSSVSKNDISNDFNVYTHNNNLIVKTDDYNTQYEVSVHNMNGQMVMSEKNNGQMETYLQVPNGIYIINLITEDGVVKKKIIVQ